MLILTKPQRKQECGKQSTEKKTMKYSSGGNPHTKIFPELTSVTKKYNTNDKSGYNGGLQDIERDTTQRKHTPRKATRGTKDRAANAMDTYKAAHAMNVYKVPISSKFLFCYLTLYLTQ